MRRNEKFYEGKEVRRIYKEWTDLWRSYKDLGHWVKVKPYRRGWTRYYVLRNDISRRKDAFYIQKALDLVNTTRYSRSKKFTTRDWRSKKDKPISQSLGYISEEKYEGLDDRIKKHLVKRIYTQKTVWGKREYVGYTLRHEYWAEFKIEPNIIVEHWIPDVEVERRRAELDLKIERHNLWPKIYREHGWSNWKWDNPYYERYKNRRGEIGNFEEEYLEEIEK